MPIMANESTRWMLTRRFFFLLLVGSVVDNVRSQFVHSACQLPTRAEEAGGSVNPTGFTFLSTDDQVEVDGQVRVLFYYNGEVSFREFSLEAWGIQSGIIADPTGHWLQPNDPTFSLISCRSDNDTVTFSSPGATPVPGVNVFTWIGDSARYCDFMFRAHGKAGGEYIEFRTAILGRYPCQNGGVCRSDGQAYSCLCHDGYSGDRCQTYDDADTQFTDTLCECQIPGTAGPNCEKDLCNLKPCQNGGECNFVNGLATCTCPDGYEGATCEMAQLNACISWPCHNGATCLPSPRTQSFICHCLNNFTGSLCETEIHAVTSACSAGPCLNGGTCLATPNARSGYVCACRSIYGGLNCQTQVLPADIDECASNPCMEGSTCYNQYNGFMCFCANGRFGRECEAALQLCDSNSCLNGGNCYRRPDSPCRCFTDVNSDMRGCAISPTCDVNNILHNLTTIPVNEANVEVISIALANATSNYGRIDAAGLALTAMVLEHMVQAGSSSVLVTQDIITIVNNVLYLREEVFAASYSAGSILETFETQLTFVRENLTRVEENVAIEVVIPSHEISATGLSYASTIPGDDGSIDDTLENHDSSLYVDRDDVPLGTAEASIGLPGEAFDKVVQEGPPVVFAVYLDSKLFQLATPGPFVLPDGSRLLVNSRVISATIGSREETVQNLMSPVVTSFLPTNASLTNEPICVFWDVVSSNWSTKGCTRSSVSAGDGVVCNCDHLTSFAILVSYHGDINDYVLDIISKVGCAISIASLLLTVLTCIVFRDLRNNPAKKSLINLCVSLLALYAVFLAGIEQVQSQVTCIVMAALIHYFFLTSVCWASAEGMNVFYLLVITQRKLLSGYLVKLMLFCWGVPAVVVGFTFLVPYLATGQLKFEHEYCFLFPGNALYFGVLLPVGLLLLFNVFIFVLVMRRLVCQRVNSSLTRRETKADAAIRHARVMLPISLILGISWLIGFLAINEATYVFQWAFAILNSLLGLAIFLLFIVGKKTGRKGLKKLLCIDQIRGITSTQTSSQGRT